MSGTLPVQILLILFFRMTISIYRHLTVAYERSTENMAFSIDGIYDIRQDALSLSHQILDKGGIHHYI